jgi:hypothetical protein
MFVTRVFFCVFACLALSAQAFGVTTLWTKAFTAEFAPQGGLRDMVGSDGTVVIVDGAAFSVSGIHKIYWIDRSGEMLAEIVPPSSDFPNTPYYVSRDELMLSGRGIALYQFVRHGQLELTRLGGGPTAYFPTSPLSYPYYLERRRLEDDAMEYTLYDLTSPRSLTIVGNAVIGIHGKNLKVRWKSVVNAKYKVQYSLDLETWIDYTEVMDGTGATLIVSIPIDEEASSFYARVVKL